MKHALRFTASLVGPLNFSTGFSFKSPGDDGAGQGRVGQYPQTTSRRVAVACVCTSFGFSKRNALLGQVLRWVLVVLGVSLGAGAKAQNFVQNGTFSTYRVSDLDPGSNPGQAPTRFATGSCASNAVTLPAGSDLGYFSSGIEYVGTGVGTPDTKLTIQCGNASYYSGLVEQSAFPGDPRYGVPPSQTWTYSNGNTTGGPYTIWQQTLTGLSPSTRYVFALYTSNAISPTQTKLVNPRVEMQVSDQSGTAFTTYGSFEVYEDGNVLSGHGGADLWDRRAVGFTTAAGQTSAVVRIRDSATGNDGDDLAMTALSVRAATSIAGTVFEDVNYGGGAGRSLAVSGGVPRPGARVELYNGAGAFLDSVRTGPGGAYLLDAPGAGQYIVRLVNNTVSSSRPGYVAGLVPVQTYIRGFNDGVGGSDPTKADGPANISAQPLASLTTATTLPQSMVFPTVVGGAAVVDVDFGFNFDVVVNTNGAGQGSLRQFILNSTALGGEAALAQAGSYLGSGVAGPLSAGVETSLFMISNGAPRPGLRAGLANQLSGAGVAVIAPATPLPAIAGNNTAVNGGTQSFNVGDTNAGVLGAGGPVGTAGAVLNRVARPEVQLSGNGTVQVGLEVQGAGNAVRGLAVVGFSGANVSVGGVNFVVADNFLGLDAARAAFNASTAPTGTSENLVILNSNGNLAGIAVVERNLIGYADNGGIPCGNSTGVTIRNNEVRSNAFLSLYQDGIGLFSSSQCVIRGNLIVDNGGMGIDTNSSAGGNEITGNTIVGNGRLDGGDTFGVSLHGTGSTVRENVIRDNYGAGVLVIASSTNNVISRNAMRGNGAVTTLTGGAATGQLGIDLWTFSDYGMFGIAPYVTPNDAGDGDGGGNDLLNFPVLATAYVGGGNLTLAGYARPGVLVEVFLAQGNNFGQGADFLFAAAEGSTQDGDAGTGSYGPGLVNGFGQGQDNTNRFSFTFPIASLTAAQQAALAAAGAKLTATATMSGSGTSEFSGNVAVRPTPVPISGVVFEDVNYGGGPGRSLAASAGVPRPGAVAQLYDGAGAFVTSDTTDAAGAYRFLAPTPGAYTVRVVSNTVASSRPGPAAGLVPVQTFRTNNGVADLNRVGGEVPGQPDAGLSATPGTSPVRLSFFGQNTSGDNTLFLDNLTLNTGSIPNNSFETPALGAGNVGAPAGAAWSFVGGAAIASNGNPYGSAAAPAGIQVALLQGSGLLEQTFVLPVGTYTLTLQAARRAYGGQPSVGGSVTINGVTTALVFAGGPVDGNALAPTSSTSYTTYTATFTVGPSAEGNVLGAFIAQSQVPVVVGSADMTGVDFGFNFDVVVNTNDAGQGSLRQFIANANALSGEAGLVQAGRNAAGGLPVGVETSLFMISDGQAHPGLRAGLADLLTGAAGARRVVLTAGSGYALTGALTALDGTTQTANVGNTNAGKLAGGYVGPVGVGPDGRVGTNDEEIIVGVDAPEVEINGNGVNSAGFLLSGTDRVLRGMAVYGFATDQVLVQGVADRVVVENNVFGLTALGTYVPGPGSNTYRGINIDPASCNDALVRNNVFEGFSGSAIYAQSGYGRIRRLSMRGNEVRNNSALVGYFSAAGFRIDGFLSDATVRGNRFAMAGVAQVVGVLIVLYSDNVVTGMDVDVVDNTIVDTNTNGILMYSQSGFGFISGAVARNLISGSPAGFGLVLYGDAGRVNYTVSRNSVFGNAGSSFDVQGPAGNTYNMRANDGLVNNNAPNRGIDYPVFTRAVLSGTALTVTGYVGSAAGQGAFGGSVVEVYKADNDGNQNGEVVLGDGRSVAHGEGRVFLDTVMVNAAGNFRRTFAVPAGATLAVGEFLTGTASKVLGPAGEPAVTSLFGGNRPVAVAISGVVFEDVNYGGGAGRSLAASGGVGRPRARVELYDGAGAFVDSVRTGAAGAYRLDAPGPGQYTVRVVNATVGSSRPGDAGAMASLVPVQTFVNADVDRVGGEAPQKVDAPANTSGQPLASLTTATQTAQSLAAITVGASAVTGVDFGFNFDLVVNTNGANQGSLFSFINNSRILDGEGALAQAGRNAAGALPVRVETSIFMISDGQAHPGLRAGLVDQLTGAPGAQRAVITPFSGVTSTLSGAFTAVDGTTQTYNIGDTNPGKLAGGYVGPVGVGPDGRAGTGDELMLTGVDAPEVEINGNNGFAWLYLLGTDQVVRGLAMYGYGNQQVLVAGVADRLLIENNVFGLTALGGNVAGPANATYQGLRFDATSCDGAQVRNNLFDNFNGGAITVGGTTTHITVRGNEVRNSSTFVANVSYGLRFDGVCSDVTVEGNRFSMAGSVRSNAIIIYHGGGNTTGGGTTGIRVLNNTMVNQSYNGFIMFSDSPSGGVLGEVSYNLISGGGGTGIQLLNVGSQPSLTLPRFTVSRNSIYGNGRSSLFLTRIFGNDGLVDADASNRGMDYPIFTSAVLTTSTTLTVAGYVGSAPLQAPFAGSTVEVFKADDDGNQNAEVVAGDGLSVPHGEGRTYLGTLTAGSDGLFSGTLTVPAGVTLAVGDVLTATASKSLVAGERLVTSAFGPNRAVTPAPVRINGYVYEDANYGGGVGRSRTALGAGAVGRPEARVELYNNAGTFITSALTSSVGAVGQYSFEAPGPGQYTVRVVNSTVSSARPGAVAGLLPVQTFANGDADRVGGEAPEKGDASANTSNQPLASLNTATAAAQTVATLVVGTSSPASVDFGFNFDVVVNTNDVGQGSLRQFILNSNALGGENSLAQAGFYANQVDLAVGATPPAVALPAQRETSIFMIAGPQARPGLRASLLNQLSPQGVAVIAVQTFLSDVTGPGTVVNGLTQTYNVGNTNDVLLGTGGTVGVDALPLARLNGPEVRLQGTRTISGGLRFANVPNAGVLGLNVYKFGTSNANGTGSDYGGLQFNGCADASVAQNVVAPDASVFGNNDPGNGNRGASHHIYAAASTGLRITNNLIGFSGSSGIYLWIGSDNAVITNNEVIGSAVNNYGALANIFSRGERATVTGNRLAGGGANGIANQGSSGNTFANNTIEGNGVGGVQTAGVLLGGPNPVVFRNVIRNNVGSGITAQYEFNGPARFSENSTYGNGSGTGQLGIDLLTNADNDRLGTAPYVTLNDDGDADRGVNGLLNFPVLETAAVGGGNLVLRGFATPGALVEVFLAAPNTVAAPNATGNNFGQGQTFLFSQTEGSGADADATTGSYGVAGALVNGVFQGTETNQNRFRFTIPLTAAQQAALSTCGTKLTATATLGGATSEFSGNVALTPAPVTVRVTGANPACAGGTVRLSTGPRTGFLFTWFNGTTIVNGSGSVLNDSVFVANAAGSYTVQLTPAGCAGASTTSPAVTITVLPAVVAGTISADQTLCAGATPAPLTGPAATGGTGTFAYQWESSPNTTWAAISGATGASYAPGPVTATTYFRRQATSGTCAAVPSNAVTITVTPGLVAGTIGADQTLCAGATPAPLTGPAASGGNGTYAYQWEASPDNTTWAAISGATGLDYSASPVTATTYFRRRVTSGTGTCATVYTAVVTITVAPALIAGTIGSSQVVCANTMPAPLTGPAANGGNGTYAYQWEASPDNNTWTAVAGATAVGYAPGSVTATTYFRRQVISGTGTCATATSNVVTITVTPALTPGTIATNQSITIGATPAPLTGSLATGGTGTYTYQWESSPDNVTWTAIAGATGLGYTPGPLTATTAYRRQVTSGTGTCATAMSNVVTITVTPGLAPGTITANQTLCAGATPAPLTGTPASGGTGTYSYQWQSSADNVAFANIAGATGVDYAPGPLTATTYFRRVVTSGAGSTATSNVVALTVPPALVAGTTAASQAVCAGATPAPLTGAAATGGTGIYAYQWEASLDNTTWTAVAGATGLGYAPGPLTATTHFRRLVTSGTGTCATAYTGIVTLTVTPTLAAGSIGSNQRLCAGATPARLTSLAGASGGTGTYAYQWESSLNNTTWSDAGSATASEYTPGPLTATTYFRRRVTSGSGTCAVAYTAEVALTVTPVLAAGTVGNDQTVCANTAPAPLTGPPATGGAGTYTYQWQSSLDNVTWVSLTGATGLSHAPGPATATTYFRRQATSGTGTCATAVSNTVTLTVTPAQAASVSLASPPTQCAGSLLTFTPTVTNGGSAPTFRWFVNNMLAAATPTFTTATLADNDQVRVELTPTPGACFSGTPTATVVVRVVAPVAPAVTIRALGTGGPACAGTVLSFGVDNATNPGLAPQYQWLLNGVPVPGSTGPTFASATLRDNDRLRLQLTSSASCASPAVATSNELVISLRVDVPPTVSITGPGATCTGTAAAFSVAASTALGTAPAYQWRVDGLDVAGATGAAFSSVTLRDGQLVTLAVRTLTATCGQPVTAVSNAVRVTIIPVVDVDAGPDKEIAEGESVVLEGTANGTYPVEWTPALGLSFAAGNPLRPVASPTVTTVYTLRANLNGCQDESRVTVKVGPPIRIPNAFSPNNDGINDTWEIDRIGNFPGNTVRVYNRWGTQIFSTSNYGRTNEWNGTSQGRAMPVGTYYYVITLGNGKSFSGPLTVVY